YYLAVPVPGQIPTNLTFRLPDSALHLTDAHYHSQGVAKALADRVEFAYFLPGQTTSFAPIVVAHLPSHRIELHSGAPTRWSGSILQQYLTPATKGFFEGEVTAPDTVYPTGKQVRQEWNEAVLGPDLSIGGTTANQVSRTGNQLVSAVSSYS